jgi:hypothetical protein
MAGSKLWIIIAHTISLFTETMAFVSTDTAGQFFELCFASSFSMNASKNAKLSIP